MTVLTSKRWENTNITNAIGYEVRYLLSNGVIGNVVRHDFDLHLQGHDFLHVNLSITVRASKGMTFAEVDICHRIGPWVWCTPFDLNFQGQTFQVVIMTSKR